MRVGFTGTREGMTRKQMARVSVLVGHLYPVEAHHGDCIGADEEFHRLVEGDCHHMIIHPPTSEEYRAFCWGKTRKAKPYLHRNRDIVDETDVLIACPKSDVEEQRSGTWSTVRYARTLGRKIYLVLPDGTTKEEN